MFSVINVHIAAIYHTSSAQYLESLAALVPVMGISVLNVHGIAGVTPREKGTDPRG